MVRPGGSSVRDNMLLLVLVVSVSTLEAYNNFPLDDGEDREMENHEVELDKWYPAKAVNEDMENLQMLKVIKLLQYSEDPTALSNVDTTKLPESFKDKDVKKWVSLWKNTHKPTNTQKQPKWKIKKGTSVLCYFKLCSFKPRPYTT